MGRGGKALILGCDSIWDLKQLKVEEISSFLLSDMFREIEFLSIWKAFDFSWGKLKWRQDFLIWPTKSREWQTWEYSLLTSYSMPKQVSLIAEGEKRKTCKQPILSVNDPLSSMSELNFCEKPRSKAAFFSLSYLCECKHWTGITACNLKLDPPFLFPA